MTTAWAGWTSDSLATGSLCVTRQMGESNRHFLVYGTDRVGHLVWQGGPLSNPYPYNLGIWYNRYNPGSGSKPGYWTSDFAIDPAPRRSTTIRSRPCIALDGDGRTFHVVWFGPDGIRYRRCTQDSKGNDKWGPIQLLQAINRNTDPVVACVPNEPNRVLVCWGTSVVVDTVSDCVIRFREYVNGAWTQVLTLDSGPSLGNPSIAAASNGNVFVAYRQSTDPDDQIFVKTRTSGVWGERVNVAPGLAGWNMYPATEVNPTTGNPHLVFLHRRPEDSFQALYHTYRDASGVWLTPEVIVSVGYQGYSVSPHSMAFVGSGTAYVAWSHNTPSTDDGIMYRYCSSEGGTWSTPEWLTHYSSSGGPALAAEEPAHAIHVAWVRTVSLNYQEEIWWKSNYLGGGGSQAEPTAISQWNIELFPNPAKAGRVMVQYALPHAGPMTVTLLDVSGRAVWSSEFGVRSSGKGSVTIDVRGLNAGVYIARLAAGDLSVSKTLVVGR